MNLNAMRELRRDTFASREMGSSSFPLTPTLSPEERGLGVQPIRKISALGQEEDSFALTDTPSAILPLPGGEGRGEGKGGLNQQLHSIWLTGEPTTLRAVGLLLPARSAGNNGIAALLSSY